MSVKKRIDYLEHYENGIKIKQEIEIDYKGLDFTESSSEFTSMDLSSSKLNLSLEIDKKIDELIMKNIQKDLISLKIQSDLIINKYIIACSIVVIIYSMLLFFKPIKSINHGFYSIILDVLPFFFLFSVFEYRNSYLKYSNALARIIITVIAVYIFICLLSFCILINLLLINSSLVSGMSLIYYFIPIFALLFIINLFWGFLYLGYRKIEELTYFYFILFNIILLDSFILSIYLKLELNLDYIPWMYLLGSLCFICATNYMILSNCSFGQKEKNNFPSQDSLFIVIDILLNMCSICFIVLLGLFLDNRLKGVKVVPLFIMIWFFNTLIIIKLIVKNTTISNFFEWKKMVIC